MNPRLRNDGHQVCGYPAKEWPRCTVCNGRIHKPTCTARMRKEVDCCPARHAMLRARGITRGIYDASQEM